MILIRKANVSDAKAIAKVHVASWQIIYRGIIPDEVLDSLSIAERESLWKNLLENNVTVFVLEEDSNLAGFVSICSSRDEDANPEIIAEISAIYIDPDRWRKGFGRLLLNTALDELENIGYHEVTLWVIDSNQQARHFYEIMGFVSGSDIQIEKRDTYTLHEIRYQKKLLQS